MMLVLGEYARFGVLWIYRTEQTPQLFRLITEFDNPEIKKIINIQVCGLVLHWVWRCEKHRKWLGYGRPPCKLMK
jgi:hypothetical protein